MQRTSRGGLTAAAAHNGCSRAAGSGRGAARCWGAAQFRSRAGRRACAVPRARRGRHRMVIGSEHPKAHHDCIVHESNEAHPCHHRAVRHASTWAQVGSVVVCTGTDRLACIPILQPACTARTHRPAAHSTNAPREGARHRVCTCLRQRRRATKRSDGTLLGGRCAFVRDAAASSHTSTNNRVSHPPQGCCAQCGRTTNWRSARLTAI
jgi:hypothetical protein